MYRVVLIVIGSELCPEQAQSIHCYQHGCTGILHELGLDQPLYIKFWHYLSGLIQGDLGRSSAQKTEVATLIWARLPASLSLMAAGRVLDLMLELQETMGLAYLFISHDMAVIERMSHHVAVMKAGRIIEQGTRRDVFENPQQGYTKSLMAAVPIPEVRLSPSTSL